MNSAPLRIAHISDLHAFTLDLSPFQFFSKRCLGNANQIFIRGNTFSEERKKALLAHFVKEKISHVIVTGDISTTSHTREFRKARLFLEQIAMLGMKVFLIPGNHDNYTKSAHKQKRFYHALGDLFFPHALSTHQVALTPLGNSWWLLLLDTTCASPYFKSHGIFSREIEKNLRETLQMLPESAKVMMANHFPLHEQSGKGRSLIHADRLVELLRTHPNVQFYLHGHTHRHSAADLRPNQLPIILDSGSISHKHKAFWHMLNLEAHKASLEVFSWDSSRTDWKPLQSQEWKLGSNL